MRLTLQPRPPALPSQCSRLHIHPTYVRTYVCACVRAQSCPTLCDPVDCSPPGSSVHGISRQDYWSGLPFPSPGDLPHPGIKPTPPTLAGIGRRILYR